jgi:hypothetical protein
MRTNLIAAIVAAGALFGLQSAALAQGAFGLSFMPNIASEYFGQTQPQQPVAPFVQGRARTTQQYYDYYGTPRRGVVVNPWFGQHN